MSDIERMILARADRLGQQYHEDHESRLAEEQRVIAEAQADRAELHRLMEIGRLAVEVLVTHDVPSVPVWNGEYLGTKIVPAIGLHSASISDLYSEDNWVENGRGWELYREVDISDRGRSQSSVGIHENGRLFDVRTKEVPARSKLKPDTRVYLPVHHYMGTLMTKQFMDSDAYLNGLAHLVSGWDVYTVTTERPVE